MNSRVCLDQNRLATARKGRVMGVPDRTDFILGTQRMDVDTLTQHECAIVLMEVLGRLGQRFGDLSGGKPIIDCVYETCPPTDFYISKPIKITAGLEDPWEVDPQRTRCIMIGLLSEAHEKNRVCKDYLLLMYNGQAVIWRYRGTVDGRSHRKQSSEFQFFTQERLEELVSPQRFESILLSVESRAEISVERLSARLNDTKHLQSFLRGITKRIGARLRIL